MKLTKEQLEYELVMRYFELRDGELWRKEHVGKDGRVMKAKPAKSTLDTATGYIRVSACGKLFYAHRIIFILTYNRPIKEGYQIDHIYGNKTDNRIENLEEVTCQENLQNKQIHRDGKLPGTSQCKRTGKWRAEIWVNGKNHFLGYFKTKEEAYRIYLLACKEVEIYGKLIRTRDERKAA